MTVTEAIAKAKGHLAVVLPEISESFELEELETPPAGLKWRFIFSATRPMGENPGLVELMRSRRVTKLVEIDPNTGDLLSVKNVAA